MPAIKNPATVSWGLDISDADFERLKNGFQPRNMDHKWQIRAKTDDELAQEAKADEETAKKAGEAEDGVELESDSDGVSDSEVDNHEVPTADDGVLEGNDHGVPENTATSGLNQHVNISIRRSWTRRELYRLVVKPREGIASPRIATVIWEWDDTYRNSGEQVKIDVAMLCRDFLNCELGAVPQYAGWQFSTMRVFYQPDPEDSSKATPTVSSDKLSLFVHANIGAPP